MQNYSKSRLTDILINLTGEPVSVYEESTGKIRTYYPQKIELPTAPRKDDQGPITHYLVTDERLRKIRGKRKLSDIAIIKNQSPGRNGKIISSLAWGKDPTIRLLVHVNARGTYFSHL